MIIIKCFILVAVLAQGFVSFVSSGKASIASAALSTLSALVVLWRGGTKHDDTARRLDTLVAWLEEPEAQTCASRQACALTYGDVDVIGRTLVGLIVLLAIFWLWRRDVAGRSIVKGTPVPASHAPTSAVPSLVSQQPARATPTPISIAELQTYRPPSRRK